MTKDIEKPTLAEKQAFWTEQLPLFKEAYWLPEHFELLKFDMEAGNFVVCDDLDPTFEDDADDLYHRINTGWSMWKRAINHMQKKLEGCVVVPVQCPDPDFADSLFDELSKKAIGEFGDDLLIHFSDIDEEKIWALMVEAAKAQAVPGQICVTRERLQELIEIGVKAALEGQK